MTGSEKIPQPIQDLYAAASAAREHSYSPYSRFSVGAALRTRDGQIFAGCNVENSTYGATVCAERVAVQSAVAALGKLEIAEIVVVTDTTPPSPPCGICRQVIAEFGPSAIVHATNLKGDVVVTPMAELLPHAFSSQHLKSRD